MEGRSFDKVVFPFAVYIQGLGSPSGFATLNNSDTAPSCRFVRFQMQLQLSHYDNSV